MARHSSTRARSRDPLFGRLAPFSKKDRVVREIRDAIVSGRMQPGDPIVEIRVARELGVGQPLIREALLALEHQGFVQRQPYKGTSVTRLGGAEIEQIQQFRIELESLAIVWARSRAQPGDIEDLRTELEGMRRAAHADDLAGFNDHDLAFHRRLWQLSGNRYLADALERALVPLLTFFYLRSGRIEPLHVASVDHHAAIVAALTNSSPADPRELVRSALSSLRDQCGVLLSRREGEP